MPLGTYHRQAEADAIDLMEADEGFYVETLPSLAHLTAYQVASICSPTTTVGYRRRLTHYCRRFSHRSFRQSAFPIQASTKCCSSVVIDASQYRRSATALWLAYIRLLHTWCQARRARHSLEKSHLSFTGSAAQPYGEQGTGAECKSHLLTKASWVACGGAGGGRNHRKAVLWNVHRCYVQFLR